MVTYKEAGVDIDAAEGLVSWLKTRCPAIGGFGGLYPLGNQYLVAGTDGVGTKLKIAFEMKRHDTIGIDLVAMCVNDVVTTGSRPLFFLDYFATGALDVEETKQVLTGIISACETVGCALLGGETAEMPGFYKEGEYDLSGFCVGIVNKEDLIDGKEITSGDVVMGLPSTGIHSNGYSLVRKIIEDQKIGLDDITFSEKTVGDVLLTPTRLYVNEVMELQKEGILKGITHITGGGLPGNLVRSFPEGCGAVIDRSSWKAPDVFQWLQDEGNVTNEVMFNTFNMGIGMAFVVGESDVETVFQCCPDTVVIGNVCCGEGVSWR